jgi:hypothetical protein
MHESAKVDCGQLILTDPNCAPLESIGNLDG